MKKRPPPLYTVEDMARAVEDIVNHNKTYAEVEQYYNIPRSVVFNRIKGRHTPLEKLGSGRALSLGTDIEYDLENCLRARARMGCPCSKEDVKTVVAEYVKSNNLKTPFVDGMPGDDWYYSFMGRHPGLSFKKPELLQKCRKDARDPFVIYDFYEDLAKLVKEYKLEDHGSFIFNCDETGFAHDATKCKAIGEKGRPLSRISGGSGRDSTTVLACVSADGSCLPPLVVFKGVGVQARWTSDKAYPGTTYTCSSNGWMEEPQFFEWFSSVFVSHVQSLRLSRDLPQQTAVLLFDGHASHISVRTIKAAMANNIHLVKFPSHLTDRIQPLDKCVFGPIKRKWDRKLVDFAKIQIESRESARLSKSLFVELLSQVWTEGMKSQNIIKGFQSTGIFPVDAKKFPETEFNSAALKKYQEAVNKVLPDPKSDFVPNPNLIPTTSSTSIMTNASLVQDCRNKLSTVNCTPEPSHPSETSNQRPISQHSVSEVGEIQQTTSSVIASSSQLFEVGLSTKSLPIHATPVKDNEETETHLTPNTIVNIFAEYNKRGQRDQVRVKQAQRQIIPRLKPLKYGEILTTQEVLEKLETAQNVRNEKKTKRKASSPESKSKTQNKKKVSCSTKQNKSPLSECEIDETALCQDSSDDSIEETIIAAATPETVYHQPRWDDLKAGIFVLVDFLGGRRNKVHYKYVCRVQEIDDGDGEIVVQGYERANNIATEFVEKSNDLSTIEFENIEAILPEPTIIHKNRKLLYVFPGSVAVFEK